MKKILISIATIVVSIISSCTLEPSDNGQLDGFWCLTQVDTLANGQSVDYHSQRVFWSFQGKIMQTRNYEAGGEESLRKYGYTFSKEGTTLKVSDPYYSMRTENDRKITEDSLFILRPQGINSLNETFTIEQLTGSKMMLRNDILRLHFEKY